MHERRLEGRAEKRGWVDAFATGEEFGTFLKEQDTEVAEILKDPRPGMSTEATTASRRVRDRAQYGVCAALALVGVVVIVDATRIGAATSSNDPVGPRALPFVIGAALVLVAALYALDVARGGVGEAEAGEDIELGARPTGARSACSPGPSRSTPSSSSGSAGSSAGRCSSPCRPSPSATATTCVVWPSASR